MYLRGGTPFFRSCMSPFLPIFIAFLRNNFRKFSKLWVLCQAIFSKSFLKFTENFLKFFNLFIIEKTNIFAPSIVQNHYINQNLAKFSLKNSQFFLKTPKFSKFSAPLAPKIWSFRKNFRVLCENWHFFGVLGENLVKFRSIWWFCTNLDAKMIVSFDFWKN